MTTNTVTPTALKNLRSNITSWYARSFMRQNSKCFKHVDHKSLEGDELKKYNIEHKELILEYTEFLTKHFDLLDANAIVLWAAELLADDPDNSVVFKYPDGRLETVAYMQFIALLLQKYEDLKLEDLLRMSREEVTELYSTLASNIYTISDRPA